MEKKKKNKDKEHFTICNMDIDSFLCGYCVCYLSWAALFRPAPGNQPELSIKEKEYFNKMEGKEGWEYVRRNVYNIDKSGESLHQRLVNLNKKLCLYALCSK